MTLYYSPSNSPLTIDLYWSNSVQSVTTQKRMSVYQLSTTVCKLIHKAEPSVKATIHDVRKYAASQSILETMKVSEVIEAINWKSPHTFWKRYMFPAKPLIRQAVLPGVASSSRN